MRGNTLHIFNPEHDLALGVAPSGHYTPPAEVRELKKYNSLLAAVYAADNDFILIPSDIRDDEISKLPYYSKVLEKSIRVIKKEDLKEHSAKFSDIRPWGWDLEIRKDLVNAGVDPRLLPSIRQIDSIRRLSHRRTAIKLRKHISEILQIPIKYPPVELFSLEEAKRFLEQNPISYFKAPWSSSGRGIVVSDHISEKGLMEWIHGTLKKQGSVIAEPAWSRVFDFATEWHIINGAVVFSGYSVFKTSSRGKYHGNVEADQINLERMITDMSPSFPSYLKAQEKALAEIIAPHYEGPLGIDCFTDSEGDINPCVEINLRLTMGHVNIFKL